MDERDEALSAGDIKKLEVIKAATEMGIKSADDLKELIEAAAHEELRARVREYAESARKLHQDLRDQIEEFESVMIRFREYLETINTAESAIRNLHIDAQKALLRRVCVAAERTESAEELAAVAASYGVLLNAREGAFGSTAIPDSGFDSDLA